MAIGKSLNWRALVQLLTGYSYPTALLVMKAPFMVPAHTTRSVSVNAVSLSGKSSCLPSSKVTPYSSCLKLPDYFYHTDASTETSSFKLRVRALEQKKLG